MSGSYSEIFLIFNLNGIEMLHLNFNFSLSTSLKTYKVVIIKLRYLFFAILLLEFLIFFLTFIA